MNTPPGTFKKTTLKCLVVSLAVALFIAGCGGGGGETAPPPSDGGTPPVQSNWSPAKNFLISTSSPVVTFNTDKNSSCRWSLLDAPYSGMSVACSIGSNAQSHSCSVSGLSEGATIFYIACADQDGSQDTSATNEHIAYTVDTVAPVVTVTFPAAGAEFTDPSRPAYVSVDYSDTMSGVSPPDLEVTFTMLGRTVDLTDLFGKELVANASSSRTDSSNNDPMARTTVSQFSSTAFTTPVKSWTLDRTGVRSLRVLVIDTTRLLVWDTAGPSIWIIDTASGTGTRLVTLTAVPTSVAVSAGNNRFYAVFQGDARFHIYSLLDGSVAGTGALPDSPAMISYNSVLNRVYIAYEVRQELGVWDCAGAAFSTAVPLDHVPALMAVWPTAAGEVLTVAAISGTVRLFRVDVTGAKLSNTSLGLQLPKDLMADVTNGYAFVSMFSLGTVAAVNFNTGVKTDISVGPEPSALFLGSTNQALVINSSDNSVSTITASTLSASPAASLALPVVDGAYLSGHGAYFIAEDLLHLPTRVAVTITASIRDNAGNTGTGQVVIYMTPDVN